MTNSSLWELTLKSPQHKPKQPKPELLIGQIFDPRKRPPVWKFDGNQAVYINSFLKEYPYFQSGYEGFRRHLPFKLPETATTIGIEIECENIRSLLNKYPFPANWVHKSDGSLRNDGVEFISPANTEEEVLPSLALMLAWIYLGRPEFSWRTSVHVHLDCTKLTPEEFKRFLLLYFLFEEALFQFANPARKETNIFCTPITRCNFYAISEFIHAPNDAVPLLKEAFNNLNAVIKKYSAINVGHMYDFGTVEFRHLRGTGDPVLLGRWLTLLCRLYQTAKEMPSDELFSYVKQLNTTSAYDEFTEQVFGSAKEHLLSPFSSFFLSRGVSLVKEILYGDTLIKISPKATSTSGLAQFVRLKSQTAKQDRLQRKVKPAALPF